MSSLHLSTAEDEGDDAPSDPDEVESVVLPPKRKGKEKQQLQSSEASPAKSKEVSDHDGEAARALFRLTSRTQTSAIGLINQYGVTRRLLTEISILMEIDIFGSIVEAMVLGVFHEGAMHDITVSMNNLDENTAKRALEVEAKGGTEEVIPTRPRITAFIKDICTDADFVKPAFVEKYREEGRASLIDDRRDTLHGDSKRFNRHADKRTVESYGPTSVIDCVAKYGKALIAACKQAYRRHGKSGQRKKGEIGPIFTASFADRLSQRVFGEGTGLGVETYPPRVKTSSRLLPETYDAGMLLELVRKSD